MLFGVFLQKGYGPGPGGLRGFQIGAVAATLGAQKTMASAFVDLDFVGLVQLLHLRRSRIDCGVDACVILAVKSQHRGFDRRERSRFR